MHLPKIPHLLLLTLFRLILVLLFIVLPFTLFTLHYWGVPRLLTLQLTEALSGKNYHIGIKRLSLNPVRGPVAEGISIRSNTGETLAHIDRIVVSLNLSDLLHKKVHIEALELDRANLKLPLAPDFEMELSEVSARILLPPDQLRISYADFTIANIQCSLTGNLLHPLQFTPPNRDKQNTKNSDIYVQLTKVLQFLREIHYTHSFPKLQITVSGDLANLPSLSAESILLQSGSFTWRTAGVNSFRLDANYRKGTFSLNALDITDRLGKLHSEGVFANKEQTGELLMHSSIDWLSWAQASGQLELLEKVRLTSSPQGELSIKYNGKETPVALTVIGEAIVEDFFVKEVPVKKLFTEFAWKPGLFLTRKAELSSPSMTGTFDLKIEKNIASLRAEGEMIPTKCLNWLDEGIQKVVKLMEFTDPGKAKITMEIPLQESAKMQGSGKLSLGRTSMRGSWIDSASGDFRIANRCATYENVQMRMGQGLGTGTIVYNFGAKEVLITGIRSTLPPAKLLDWVDDDVAEAASPYRLRGFPAIQGDVKIYALDPLKNRLDLKIQAKEGLDFELLGKDLAFGPTTGTLTMRGRQLKVDVTKASLFGGNLGLKADVSLDKQNPSYQLQVNLSRIDFPSINKLYFNYAGSEGLLSGDFSYRAKFTDQSHLEGRGSIRVEDGNVFAIPLLGPFSGIIDTLIPGSGYQKARLATADFTVKNQVIRTENLEVLGKQFSLYGVGDIRFMADELDMAVRINAKGATGVLLFPVSKFFEYESSGTVSKPTWRPKNLPREIYGEGMVETVTAPVRQLFWNDSEKQPPVAVPPKEETKKPKKTSQSNSKEDLAPKIR